MAVAQAATRCGELAVGGGRRDIQGLRALAVLLVVVFHSGLPLPDGYVGVDVFFVISGFVITNMLVARLEAPGRVSLRHFYLRRVRRLLPALAVMLATVGLLAVLFNPIGTQVLAARTAIAAALFSANAYLFWSSAGYFDTSSSLNPFLHTWSLVVEEQFYLVFPVVLIAAWRCGARRSATRGSRRCAASVIAAGSAVSFALSVVMSNGTDVIGLGNPQSFAYYSSPTRAWEFGVGVLVALWWPTLAGAGRRLRRKVPALTTPSRR